MFNECSSLLTETSIFFTFSVSHGFEKHSKCLAKVLSGQYDVGFESIPFPVKEKYQLIQDSFILSSKPGILTPVVEKIGYFSIEPDFKVFPATIYTAICFFIVSCSILNVLTYKLSRSSKSSWANLTKKFLSNLFNLTFAHAGKSRSKSKLKLLHFAIILNVTNFNFIYNAHFSTRRVQIEYPKMYDSYKSIYMDNALMLFMGSRHIANYFRNHTFAPSSVEIYLQRMMNNTQKVKAQLKGERNLCKIVDTFQREKKLVTIAHTFLERKYGCNVMKGCIKKYQGKRKNPRVLIRYDADVGEIKNQILISASVRNKSGSDILLKRMRMLSENALYLAIHQFESSLGRRAGARTSRAFFDSRNCVSESVEPEIDSFENINLKVIHKVFYLFPILIELACVFIVVEFATHHCFRRAKVAPMK